MSDSSPKATANGRKRALALIIDVKEEFFSLRCLPIVTKRCSSHVQSSNIGEDTSSQVQSSNLGEDTSSQVQSSNLGGDNSSSDESDNNGFEECTTPKAEECRIPEVMMCPPAPRKRRVTSSRRSSAPPSSAGFFRSVDLELLFMPRHNISTRM